MPSLIMLLLFVLGMVLWVAIESGLTLASWRAFRTAFWQYGLYVLALAALCGVAAVATFMLI